MSRTEFQVNTHPFEQIEPPIWTRIIIKGGTEGIYNADQIAFTPVRIAVFVVGSGAIASGLFFVLGPWAALLVIVPAIFLIGGSMLRAARVKSKDINHLFTQLVPENQRERFTFTEKTLQRTFHLGAPETVKEFSTEKEGRLYAATVRQDLKDLTRDTSTKELKPQCYFTAYYEVLENEVYKRYVVNIRLTRAEYEDYLAADAEAQKTKRLAWLQQVTRATITNEKLTSSIKQALLKLKSSWVKHYTGMSILEIAHEIVWVPFEFFFGGAMMYWTLWSFAALLGIGFIDIGLATEFLLPFGSPLIAFGIPLAFALVLAVAKAVTTYQLRNVPKNQAETESLAQMLFQIKAAQVTAAKSLEAAGINTDTQKNFLAQLPTQPEPRSVKSHLRRRWDSFWYSIATLFVTDYSLRNMLATTYVGSVARVSLNAILRFSTGFILGFIALWPLFDFGFFSWGLPMVTLLIVQFAASLVSGTLFASNTIWKQGQSERARLKALRDLDNNPALRDRLLALEDYLNNQRVVTADLQKQAQKLIDKQIAARALELKAEENLSLLAYLKKWPDYKHQARLELGYGHTVVAHDEWEFTGKFNTQEKTARIKLWTWVKRFFDRFNEFIAAYGTGGLLVRLAIAASSLGLGLFGGAIGFGTPVIIALAVFGFGWACLRLLRLLDSKNLRATNQFLARGPEAAEQTMLAEAQIIYALQQRLKSLLENAQKPSATTAALPSAYPQPVIAAAPSTPTREAAAQPASGWTARGAMSVSPPTAAISPHPAATEPSRKPSSSSVFSGIAGGVGSNAQSEEIGITDATQLLDQQPAIISL